MNPTLIKIAAVLLSLIVIAFIAFSSGLMANISYLSEGFEVLPNSDEDMLNYKF